MPGAAREGICRIFVCITTWQLVQPSEIWETRVKGMERLVSGRHMGIS